MPSNKKSLTDLNLLYKEIQAEKSRLAALVPPEAPAVVRPEQAKDNKLFARATRTVVPLKTASRIVHQPSKADNPEVVAQRRKQALGAARVDASVTRPLLVSDGPGVYADLNRVDAPDSTFAATGVGPDTIRKLKQAYWPIGAQLDLHGLNADQARGRLVDFIETSREFGTRCVKVIHGKGYGSKQGQPVLKQLVAHWLTQIGAVQAFATPPNTHGGQGVLFVLLKPRSASKLS